MLRKFQGFAQIKIASWRFLHFNGAIAKTAFSLPLKSRPKSGIVFSVEFSTNHIQCLRSIKAFYGFRVFFAKAIY